MISEKNFSNMDPAEIPVDSSYERCNFSQSQPASLGPAVGVRLFPGDDTPRTFTDCNLFNCEPPPGSILNNCNTWIVSTGELGPIDELIVDGVVQDTTQYHDRTLYGKYDATLGDYVYEPVPVTTPEDY